MEYDVVMPTRDRLKALRMSVPLILEQSRRPRRLIVVDASADHGQVRDVVEAMGEKYAVDTIVIESPKACCAFQRNVGLEHVESPVVMLPDDDSLWYPGVAEAIMRVYERDISLVVGGVCSAEARFSPLSPATVTYRKPLGERCKRALASIRNRFQDAFVPSPLGLYAHDCWREQVAPDWLDAENAVLVEWMTGFRMSFRTEVIRQRRFDETLGAFMGYALFEDAEMCTRVLNDGLLLVGARNAQIYHHKFPTHRAGGDMYGFAQVANYLYVVRKYLLRDSRPWKAVKRFMHFKLLLYSLRAFDAYGRQRLRGAWVAWRHRNRILNADLCDLRDNYLNLWRQFAAAAERL